MADAAYRAKINIPSTVATVPAVPASATAKAAPTPKAFISRTPSPTRSRQGCPDLPDEAGLRLRDPHPGLFRRVQDRSRRPRRHLTEIDRNSPTTVSFKPKPTRPISFLPGQYMNLRPRHPGKPAPTPSAAPPNQTGVSFLIRDVPNGLMSTFMRQRASTGDTMTFTGPYGSFCLRPVERPVLMLAGGTGLAPFLSMLLSPEQPARPADSAGLRREHQRRPRRAEP